MYIVGGAFAFNAPALSDYSFTASADEEVKTYGVWSYTENEDGTINIVSCTSTEEEIVFPATLNVK